MRARAIIEVALQKAKVLASGETADPADMKLALDALNAMIEAWALSPQMILVPGLSGPYPLVNGQTTYTIGPTGDFVGPRPASLVDASFIRQDGYDTPIRLISFEDYASIGNKTEGGWNWMWYSPGPAVGTIVIGEEPFTGGALYLAVRGAFAQFPDFDTDVPLAPGYKRTLQFNLAVEIAEDFGRQLSPNVQRTAANAKRVLKRANAIVPRARSALDGWGLGYGYYGIGGPDGYGGGNYLTDEGGVLLTGD